MLDMLDIEAQLLTEDNCQMTFLNQFILFGTWLNIIDVYRESINLYLYALNSTKMLGHVHLI